MIQTISDKQLIEDVHNYDVVLFGMGINNSMNKGLAYDIALNFPEVHANENLTGYGDTRKYGTVGETLTEDGVRFCSCYCYNIGLKRKNNGVFIDYEALEKCLTHIHNHHKNKRIASPIIGQDKYDGNGDKQKICNIFEKVFGSECDLTLYDFVQQDFKEERYKEAVAARKAYTDGKISKEEFTHLKKINEWKRIHGIFKEMPDEFEYKPRRKTQNKIVISNKKIQQFL